MRVAFVGMETTRTADTAGNRRFERVARLLAERGHEVTRFCGQWWDDYRTEFEADGVRHRGVTLGEALPSFCLRIPVLLAKYRPDVVHVRPHPTEQVLAAGVGSSLARAPLVLEWYGDEGLADDRPTRRAASRPAHVITPSELVRTEVRERGASGDRVSVIPESIEYPLVERVEPAAQVDVAYAHPLDGSANVEDLLLGLAELRDREWQATVIGDGPNRAAAEQQAADLRIDDRVTFAGACDREERVAIYRGAHAFVQTAFREQFATELLWALACGCVGIVEYQADSSAHELVENYPRSYRVTDPQGLGDAILDAGEFERLTAEDTWATFDHGAVLERYVDTYAELADEFGLL